MLSTTQSILLIITSFLPPIIYSIWIRNTERIHRERWIAIAVCFLWGASISIIAAIILEEVLDMSLSFSLIHDSPPILHTIAFLMIAPFAEELVKPLALRNKIVYRELNEFEDGLIFGAVAGLGFSATENLLYGFGFFSKGLLYFLVLMSIRSVGGCLLHASATALTGYGYGKALLTKKSIIRVTPYFIAAMLMHASYNFLVTFEDIGVFSGLILALIIVIISWSYIRKKIRSLDG